MSDPTKPATPQGQASTRYAQLSSEREPYLVRARRLAGLTIPSLFREVGDNGTTDQEVPWTNFGAYAVNNLTAKIILTLFPPSTAFVKLKMDKKTEMDLALLPDDERGQLKAEIDAGYSLVEQEFADCIEEDGDRAKLNSGGRKQLVGGTHGFQFYPEDASVRGIPLDRFVTRRDGRGRLLEFIVEDNLAFETLPTDIQDMVILKGHDPAKSPYEVFKVYTAGKMERDGKWTTYQEVYGCDVPGSRNTWSDEAMPFLFTPFNLLEGEHYGRSYVEDYEGDLQTLEGNTQSITEAAASIARFITLVNPVGLTSKKNVAEARNGAVISGRAEDVEVFESGIGRDMNFVGSVNDKVEMRLSRAFLVASAVRNAERVTKEEIQMMAGELEQQLGGTYSQQVTTFQTPYARKKMHYLQMAGRMIKLPKSSTRMTVVAGSAGLGRNVKLQALDAFLMGTAQVLGPQIVQERVNPSVYLLQRAAALGIDTAGLIYSEDAIAEKQAAQQQAMMTQQLAPEAVRTIGSNVQATNTANINADAKIAAEEIKASAQPTNQEAPV